MPSKVEAEVARESLTSPLPLGTSSQCDQDKKGQAEREGSLPPAHPWSSFSSKSCRQCRAETTNKDT